MGIEIAPVYGIGAIIGDTMIILLIAVTEWRRKALTDVLATVVQQQMELIKVLEAKQNAD